MLDKIAYKIAKESKDIVDDVLDESFDSAALEANFKQRVNDEVENIQPEWTQFKDDTVQQLAQKANKTFVDSEVERIDDGLNSVSSQLAQKANKDIVTLLEYRMDDVIQSADLDPNKDQEIVDARLGKPTLSDKLQSGAFKTTGKNLLDMTTLTSGFYVNYNHGGLIAVTNYSASDFIAIRPSETYVLSNQLSSVKTLEQFAFYDDTKTFISGWEGGSSPYTFTTPTNARYIRLSIADSRNQGIQLEQNDVMTEYEPYEYGLNISDFKKEQITAEYLSDSIKDNIDAKKVISVKKDGSGDFDNLREALESITDASKTNKYEVQIYEGVYDVFSDYTTAEIEDANFIGPIKPDWVDIIGIGVVKVKGELSTSITNATMRRVSTLVTYGNGRLENLKVTAKNLRYAVHDDYNFPNAKREVKDCEFLYFQDVDGYKIAYGAGTFSGMEMYFENCYFYTESTNQAFTCHNNVNFTTPSKVALKNCQFENKGGLTVRFGSMGSGQADVAEMIGCRTGAGVYLFEEQSNGVGIDWKLSGYGNDLSVVEIRHSHPTQQVTYDFQGETRALYSADSTKILKGSPVRFNGGASAIYGTGVTALNVVGIAFEDIEPNTNGIVKVGGYMHKDEIGLLDLVIGDKVGVVSGALAKVTTGDYVGRMITSNFMKLTI